MEQGVQSRPGDDPCLSRPGSMSAEDPEGRAAADDGSSGGSGSPSPGDTLPWNLGKTQRSRRSGGGPGGNGSVLDPAERAVIRIAGNASPPAAAPCRGSRASNPRRPPLWRHLPLLRGRLRPARRAPRSGCRAADGGGALVAQLSEGWRLGKGRPSPRPRGGAWRCSVALGGAAGHVRGAGRVDGHGCIQPLLFPGVLPLQMLLALGARPRARSRGGSCAPTR